MKPLAVSLSLGLAAASAFGGMLPGFRVARVAELHGFPTSLAIDTRNTIYYTVNTGTVYRLDGETSTAVAHVITEGDGNAGLLGMALIDDQSAALHYTTPRQTHDVVSIVDLGSGAERVVKDFACDIYYPERGASTEHHGGNPTVAPDGSIFVGIGEYNGRVIAQIPDWNGGKAFRIAPDGTTTQYALGLRNPFDLAWDDQRKQLIIADNGPSAGDEIHIVGEGTNCGWPWTWGDRPAIDGAKAPDYVFPSTIAPTGLALLSGRNAHFPAGFLLGSFVTKAIYYFPDLDQRPLGDPIPVIEGETDFVIDIAESASGEIFFVTGSFTGPSALYRLIPPLRGDCDGNGLRNREDLDALALELRDGLEQETIATQKGSYSGSWGCDANLDGFVTIDDELEIRNLQQVRSRAVRGR